MSAFTHALPRPAWSKLAITEAKLLAREPVVLFWGIAFPVILLIIFGVAADTPEKDLGGLRLVDVYMPIVIAMALTVLAVSALPPTLATYRERGILRRLSTTPAPPALLLTAQVVVNVVVAAVALAILLVVGRVAFDVALPQQVPAFLLALVLAAAALLAIGLVVAAVAPTARMAAAISTILFFPLMFFAGLWAARPLMPDALLQVGDFTPLGAAVQALQDATLGEWPRPLHLGVMAAYAIVFGVAAARWFRWE
jgi:ABC-2 type transport system permease protein